MPKGKMSFAKHGFEVFIVPNPGSTRSGDFILRKKNFIGLYDLKTITGLSSVGNRLADSKGQANRIVLNIISKYNPKSLTKVIRSYFYQNNDALEVKVLKWNKLIDVNKSDISEKFDVSFVREYVK
ncbi:MAG: hypothetical protein SOT20_05660 [Candidatus Cryptobacteroides sp.]|nr:hypothetical protein [Candidatus Cryptobacteroides sp.]